MKRYIFTSISLALSLLVVQSQVSAFSVSTDAALPELQCTEFRDGNRVYESKYIYINNNGMYTNENGTYAGIYPKDVFFNYGNEFVIRSLASSINVANNLPGKINVPNTQTDWSMPTNYIPSADSEYIVMGAKTPISINRSMLVPNDAVNPAFQIAYTLTRVGVNNGSSRSLGPIVWQYVPFGASVATKPWGDMPRALKVNNTDITKVECFNYYARWCGDGILDTTKGEVCDDGAQNGQLGSCNTTCTGPTVILPACVPGTTTGPQTAPLTAASPGLCPANQTVGGFVGTTVGTLTTYNWSCNGSAVGGACAATYNSNATSPSLSLKKYAKSIATGDSDSAPVSIARGETFSYFYQVQNTGAIVATGVVIKDTLPSYLTFTGNITIVNPTGVDVTSDWTIATGSQIFGSETVPRIYLILSKKTDWPANSGLYTFSIPVTLSSTAPQATSMQNIAYVCAANSTANPTGPNGEVICGNTNPPPPPPPFICTPTNNPLKDPACITIGPIVPGFDLSLKKYIGTNDAQTAIATSPNALFSYVIRVTNSGASRDSSSGVTTVQDILPTGVEYVGSGVNTATGAGWTCNSSSRTLTCTSTGVVGSGASYPDITVPVRVTATSGQVTNIAAVTNPSEVPTGRCMVSGGLPTTDTGICTLDANNSDPAVLGIALPGGPGGGGGASNVGFKCVGGVSSCALYNSLIACEAEVGKGNCDSADASGQARCANRVTQSPICIGGGSVSCGDGVLQPNLGEECDVVGGAAWCQSCKVTLKTNPGANPITDIWMTIPTFAGTNHLGYSWLDGMPGRIAFQDNRMVLGQGTKAFTLADTVGFGIKTQYTIPLIIPASKRICLKSEGSALNGASICTTFGEAGTNLSKWTRADGEQFVNMGQGYYQILNLDLKPDEPTLPANPVRKRSESDVDFQQRVDQYNTAFDAYMIDKKNYDDWRQYKPAYSNSSNEILLFKGAKKYSSENNNSLATLNSTFYGMSTGEATISLYTPDNGIILSVLPVRTSAAVVASIGASANRSLETFLNRTNPFAGFITNGSVSVNTEISTTKNNQVANIVNPVKLPTTGIKKTGPVTNVQDLEKDYALNGNKNIFAIDGDLTISCPPGKTFEMTGVRTVIVNNGNLIIKCNITYADANASWAWIANGGDILIDNGEGNVNNKGITNLAGVYVATTGKFAPIEGKVTQAVLKVEGSMYGNATPLFNSRLYARATSAYDILTTGTVLTYSNRALVSPPPLLSQYLGNYSVQRVIQ